MLKRRVTIQRGQLVLDRRVELPEGSVVEITIAEGDEDLDLSDAELEERDDILAAGLRRSCAAKALMPASGSL